MRFFTYALLLLGLLTCIGVLYFRHETQAAEQAIRAEQQGTPAALPSQTNAVPSAASPPVAAPSAEVSRLVALETRRMRSLTDHPDEDAARLRIEAAAFTVGDCAGLAELAGNLSVHPDRRFTAAYLLAGARPDVSVSALAQLALSPIPPGTPEQVRLERILRSFALEGLSEAHGSSDAEAALLQLAQSDSPLQTRARQALAAYLGKRPPVQEQDAAVLTDLIARGGTPQN